jgi:hypothetical protein
MTLGMFRTECPWLAHSLNTTALIEELMFPITKPIYIGFLGVARWTSVRHGFGNRMSNG